MQRCGGLLCLVLCVCIGRHAPKKKKHVEEPADIEVDVEDVEVEGMHVDCLPASDSVLMLMC